MNGIWPIIQAVALVAMGVVCTRVWERWRASCASTSRPPATPTPLGWATPEANSSAAVPLSEPLSSCFLCGAALCDTQESVVPGQKSCSACGAPLQDGLWVGHTPLTASEASPANLAPLPTTTDSPAMVKPAHIRVMVVDDNSLVRDLMQETLLDSGFCIDRAASGEEALSRLTVTPPETAPHVLLLDWKMPGIDGLETVKRLRALSGCGHLPRVILHTCHHTAALFASVPASGTDAVLDKLADSATLHATISRVMAPWIAECVPATPDERDVRPLRQGTRTLVPPAKPQPSAFPVVSSPMLSSPMEQPPLPTGREYTRTDASLPGTPSAHKVSPATHTFPDTLDVHPALRRVGNNVVLYRRLLAEYRTENSDIMERLELAATEEQQDDLSRLLHTLKGVSAGLGAVVVTEAAAHAESRLRVYKQEAAASATLTGPATPLITIMREPFARLRTAVEKTLHDILSVTTGPWPCGTAPDPIAALRGGTLAGGHALPLTPRGVAVSSLPTLSAPASPTVPSSPSGLPDKALQDLPDDTTTDTAFPQQVAGAPPAPALASNHDQVCATVQSVMDLLLQNSPSAEAVFNTVREPLAMRAPEAVEAFSDAMYRFEFLEARTILETMLAKMADSTNS